MYSTYQCQLVLLRVPLHDGGPGPHLGHDAARPPHVHSWAIVPLTQEELRRSIPQGDHTVGVSVRVPLLGDGDCSCKTKVSKLQDALLGDQDVGSFHVSEDNKHWSDRVKNMDEIPVDDLVVVDEEEALAHLLHNLLDLAETELHVDVAEQTSQVVLAEVEHEIECGLVPAVLPADLDEVDDVLMVEQLEDPDLPESSDRKAFLLIFHQNFLQSHNLTAVSSILGLEKNN